MKFINALAVAGLAFVASNALTVPPQGFRDITPKQLLSEVNFGLNLGNTLDAYDNNRLNTEGYDSYSETCWGNVKTHEGIFTTLMDNKFNIFRLATTWKGHFGEAPDYKINDAWLKRVREVVDLAYNNGAYVILNTQHEDWNYAFYDNYEKAKDITEKLWTQIAEEFKDYGEHLIFESFNEPRKVDSPVEWTGGDEEGWDVVNKLNNDFVKTVRKTGGYNDKRILMVPLYAAACNELTIKNFVYPEGDDKVIADIHAYLPYNFALNPGPEATPYFTEENKKELDTCLDLVKERFVDNDEPVIFGEFGAQKRGDNLEDRARWAEYYVSRNTAMGIPQLWWDNGVFEGEGVERFGLIDRKNSKIVYPSIVAAMQKGRGLEVNVLHPSKVEGVLDDDLEEPTESLQTTEVFVEQPTESTEDSEVEVDAEVATDDVDSDEDSN